MFRRIRSSSGPPRRQIQELFSFLAMWDPKFLQVFLLQHLGTHNAGKLNSSLICLLGGPEDDLLGRNMSP